MQPKKIIVFANKMLKFKWEYESTYPDFIHRYLRRISLTTREL